MTFFGLAIPIDPTVDGNQKSGGSKTHRLDGAKKTVEKMLGF